MAFGKYIPLLGLGSSGSFAILLSALLRAQPPPGCVSCPPCTPPPLPGGTSLRGFLSPSEGGSGHFPLTTASCPDPRLRSLAPSPFWLSVRFLSELTTCHLPGCPQAWTPGREAHLPGRGPRPPCPLSLSCQKGHQGPKAPTCCSHARSREHSKGDFKEKECLWSKKSWSFM